MEHLGTVGSTSSVSEFVCPFDDINETAFSNKIQRIMSFIFNLLQSEKKDGSPNTDFIPESEEIMSPAIARAASGMSSPRYKGANPFDEASISGDFFEALTNSEFYKNAKVC